MSKVLSEETCSRARRGIKAYFDLSPIKGIEVTDVEVGWVLFSEMCPEPMYRVRVKTAEGYGAKVDTSEEEIVNMAESFSVAHRYGRMLADLLEFERDRAERME